MALCVHGRRIGYVHCPICNPTFDQNQAILIGWKARREGGRWESAVEEYCFKCGGRGEDIHRVLHVIKPAVLRDMPPIPAGMIPEREVIHVKS